jgi:predicted transcriptional regulator
MDPPKELQAIATQLRQGETPESVSVKKLLSWFNAQRRGYFIVQRIRGALAQLGLRTEPDFEQIWIGYPLEFMMADATQPVAVVSSDEQRPGSQVPSTGTASHVLFSQDPTYRLRILPAANRPPLRVKPTASIQEAVTHMLSHDFSQLPVMETEREVKGMISWESIGVRLSLGLQCASVQDCMEPPNILEDTSPLFAALETIARSDYVLVRHGDKRIGGIVTSADLSLQFRQLAEPFMLLEEIENHIRHLIHGKFSPDALSIARDPDDDDRAVAAVADLTFGEYIRLLQDPDRWSVLRLNLDRSVFIKALDEVRRIRNDVMHFNPDPISDEDLDRLREFSKMMQALRHTGAI